MNIIDLDMRNGLGFSVVIGLRPQCVRKKQ